MGRLLGVGERKERSEGRGTGLPWDEAEGPIPLATKLPKKASPAERRGGHQAANQAAATQPPPQASISPPLCVAEDWQGSQRVLSGPWLQTGPRAPQPDPGLEKAADPRKKTRTWPPSSPHQGTRTQGRAVPSCCMPGLGLRSTLLPICRWKSEAGSRAGSRDPPPKLQSKEVGGLEGEGPHSELSGAPEAGRAPSRRTSQDPTAAPEPPGAQPPPHDQGSETGRAWPHSQGAVSHARPVGIPAPTLAPRGQRNRE